MTLPDSIKQVAEAEIEGTKGPGRAGYLEGVKWLYAHLQSLAPEFDAKAASDKFEQMRKEEEIGDEAFVSAGYHCHDVIVSLARWQYEQDKVLIGMSQITIDCLVAKLGAAEDEVKCLRSVLSEWDFDKSCYTQMIRANSLNKQRGGPGKC